MKSELAKFFGVDESRVWMECPQDSYSLDEEEGQKVLKICLNKEDKQKRCEFSIHDLPLSPAVNHISFEFNHTDTMRRRLWETVMQIHSFPDKGEEWRCPVAPLEIEKGTLRMVNRWDPSAISRPVGYNCAGAGSTLSSRTIKDNIKLTPGSWQKVQLDMKLSYNGDGSIQLKLDDADSGPIKGPNRYNDQKLPFLKFGIYKPTGWESTHKSTCTKYRNVKITSGNE